MTWCPVFTLVAWLITVPVFAQDVPTFSLTKDSTALHIVLCSYMAAQGADLATTFYAIGANKGTEANPILAPLVRYPFAIGAIKMGVAAGTSWALIKLHKTHPRLAFWVALVGTAGVSAVAWHNAQLGSRL